MSAFETVIGLEVHAQLLTQSKIFCGCPTAFGQKPNHHTCPVCLALPGALPVLNAKVVELAVRTGLALGCRVRPVSVWARKNYFYPDLPKGYQISQFDQPICEGGAVEFDGPKGARRVALRRIHMEEDAGKSVHDAGGGLSLVDLNRAGVPLLEIVSEPELSSSDEAAEYLRTLRDILVYLGVNDGNLEEGSFRCDANVSVRRAGQKEMGTRAELKNLNSFRFVKEAIDCEVARQIELCEAGRPVLQQTRLYDPDRRETRAMRSKEEAHDYRYFPDPDLPQLTVSQALIEKVRPTVTELPRARVARFQTQLGLTDYDAKVLCAERAKADYFEGVLAALASSGSGGPAGQKGALAKTVANWIIGELTRLLNEAQLGFDKLALAPSGLAELVGAVERKEVSRNAAKDVLAQMLKTGKAAAAIIAEQGLSQVSDGGAIEAVVNEVLAKAQGDVEKYRAGKKQLYGYFVGQVMKAMKGKADPAVVNELLKKKLDG